MWYILAPVYGDEHQERPDWLIAPIDSVRMEKILTMQQVCKDYDLTGADVSEPSLEWGYSFDPDDPVGSSSETTSVTKHDIQYSALPKHDGPSYATSAISILEIEQLMKRPEGSVLLIDEFHWMEEENLPGHITSALRASALEKRVENGELTHLRPKTL